MDLTFATLVEIRDAVRVRRISAVEVTKHFLARIERLDKDLNSFITVNPNALEQARAVDRVISSGADPGVLAGVPLAIKDLFCTQNLRTTAGSRALENFVPPYTATAVRKLEAAGAITLGKTNLDEFAMGSSNETSAFGLVRNPWNTEYVPGGSSGGSAAALAARLAPGALGTDTGGSVRQPASFCGVYGIKPTYGRISRYGMIAYASSLDQAGPMAASTADLAILLEAASGLDDRDATSAGSKVPAWSVQLNSDLQGVRVGVLSEYVGAELDNDVSRVMQEALRALEARGAKIVDVSVPLVEHAVSIYYLIATSEASSNLARYDGIRYGYRAPAAQSQVKDLDDFYGRNRGEAFGTEVKRRIMLGTYALASGYYDAYYQKACCVRRLLRDEFLSAFQSCDVILSPVAASPAFKIGSRISDPLQMYLNDMFTTSTNLAGLPGMSVPFGFSQAGLPIGVQLTAKHFDEQSLLNASLALEKSRAPESRVPNVI